MAHLHTNDGGCLVFQGTGVGRSGKPSPWRTCINDEGGFFFREQELEALESPAHCASIGELHHIPDKWRKHSDHNPSNKCNNSKE